MEGEDDRRDDIPESPPPMRASSSSAAKKSSASSLVGAMRGCLNPFLFVVTMSNLRQTKRARKILRHADPNRKQRKNRARVRFRLPKSKTVRVIQPFESDSVFIRRWRHFMVRSPAVLDAPIPDLGAERLFFRLDPSAMKSGRSPSGLPSVPDPIVYSAQKNLIAAVSDRAVICVAQANRGCTLS